MSEHDDTWRDVELLAEYYSRRLARLEARFAVLCERARALGVDTANLDEADPLQPPPALRIVRSRN